jgi:hypothetical protein
VRESIAVEVRFGDDGGLRPLAFEWRGRHFRVASLGRQWQEGSVQHFLVMTPEEQVYELAYAPEPAAGQWWLLHAPKDPRRGTLA